MKIADDDKIYEALDKWHDEDEYDKILDTIFKIPREQWSNKLWFRVISAYNNKSEFHEAIDELTELKEHCTEAADIAKWHYMFAYIFYMRDQYVMAKKFLEKAVEYAPEREDYQEFLEECEEYIEKKVDKARIVFEYAEEWLAKAEKELQEKGEKKDCEGVEFWALLSFPAAFRIYPGLPHCMGVETFYKCSTEEEKQELREFLATELGITDVESTKEAFTSFHCGFEYEDFVAAWNGEGIDVSQLDILKSSVYESCLFFGEVIRDYVPEGGIHAADIVEMMMVLRMAYACDILSNYDYSQAALALADWVQEIYHSWQEYAMATFCGIAYSVYRSSYSNLKETIEVMSKQLTFMPHLDYLYYNWEEE